MTTRKFTKTYLIDELKLPYGNKDKVVVIEDTLTYSSRWSIGHELIFRLPDQKEDEGWQVSYSIGATECQDESPWEYEDEIKGTLVRLVEKVVKTWVEAD